MRAHTSHPGFSLVELLVVLAMLAIGAAVAIASFARTSSMANLRESFVETAAAAKAKATDAVGGAPSSFSIERDGRLRSGLVVNPKYISAPPGTEQAHEIAFEGGTGNARLDGRRAVVSIVICERGEPDVAYAIVAGTAGRVELLTYANEEWRAFQ